MRKRWLIQYILLFAFWIVISAEADLQHILTGAFLALIIVWFWRDLGPRQPGVPSAGKFLRFIYCLVLLAGYVIQANISVAKTMLFSKPPAKPMLMVMTIEPPIKSNWGRVLLATCITITPGTVTVDVNPETGQFMIHTLSVENANDLLHWRMIDEIRKLES